MAYYKACELLLDNEIEAAIRSGKTVFEIEEDLSNWLTEFLEMNKQKYLYQSIFSSMIGDLLCVPKKPKLHLVKPKAQGGK